MRWILDEERGTFLPAYPITPVRKPVNKKLVILLLFGQEIHKPSDHPAGVLSIDSLTAAHRINLLKQAIKTHVQKWRNFSYI